MYQREEAAAASRAIQLVLLVLSVCLSGCALASDTHEVLWLAKRTTKLEPKYFPYVRNERLTRLQNHNFAKGVWRDEIAPTLDFYPSGDYAAGFIDGFADYLHRGGSGEPPPVAPRGYWGFPFQSKKGKEAVHDWYAGFRHGAAECKARGLRDLVVVPSSLIANGEIAQESNASSLSSKEERGPDSELDHLIDGLFEAAPEAEQAVTAVNSSSNESAQIGPENPEEAQDAPEADEERHGAEQLAADVPPAPPFALTDSKVMPAATSSETDDASVTESTEPPLRLIAGGGEPQTGAPAPVETPLTQQPASDVNAQSDSARAPLRFVDDLVATGPIHIPEGAELADVAQSKEGKTAVQFIHGVGLEKEDTQSRDEEITYDDDPDHPAVDEAETRERDQSSG